MRIVLEYPVGVIVDKGVTRPGGCLVEYTEGGTTNRYAMTDRGEILRTLAVWLRVPEVDAAVLTKPARRPGNRRTKRGRR